MFNRWIQFLTFGETNSWLNYDVIALSVSKVPFKKACAMATSVPFSAPLSMIYSIERLSIFIVRARVSPWARDTRWDKSYYRGQVAASTWQSVPMPKRSAAYEHGNHIRLKPHCLMDAICLNPIIPRNSSRLPFSLADAILFAVTTKTCYLLFYLVHLARVLFSFAGNVWRDDLPLYSDVEFWRLLMAIYMQETR